MLPFVAGSLSVFSSQKQGAAPGFIEKKKLWIGFLETVVSFYVSSLSLFILYSGHDEIKKKREKDREDMLGRER